MEHTLPLQLATVLILGIGAQWFAWKIKLPSILPLLVLGCLAGSIFHFIDADLMLGKLFLPFVSLSVAIILFEGGLNLRISDLKENGTVVRKLISQGALLTLVLAAVASKYIFQLDWSIAILLGSVLTVTGPTVILPMLRHIRPVGKTGPILKWEGILIDPLGAMLAVLVFDFFFHTEYETGKLSALWMVFKILFIGGFVGTFIAYWLIFFLKKHWIPDYLHNLVTLLMVVLAFAGSNLIQNESGLLTVTILGITLGNQRSISVKNIIEFKENLSLLLISVLFILLASRLDFNSLLHLNWRGFAFLAVLVLIIRPAAVFLSTLNANLTIKEKWFLSFMAPRGIVAAAVASIFALKLLNQGHDQAELIVPITFFVIIGTVLLYGFVTPSIAKGLKISKSDPQGIVFMGAFSWSIALAKILIKEGVEVLIVDSNRENLKVARMEGIRTYYTVIFSEYIMDEIELGSFGHLLNFNPDEELSAIITLHFSDFFGRSRIYQLAQEEVRSTKNPILPKHLQGRLLFGESITGKRFKSYFDDGRVVKSNKLTEEFSYADYKKLYGEKNLPLFLISEKKSVAVFCKDGNPSPKPGHTLISLVPPLAAR